MTVNANEYIMDEHIEFLYFVCVSHRGLWLKIMKIYDGSQAIGLSIQMVVMVTMIKSNFLISIP